MELKRITGSSYQLQHSRRIKKFSKEFSTWLQIEESGSFWSQQILCSIYLNIITAVIESTIDKTVAQELFDLLISQTFLVAKRRLHIFVSIILHTMFYSNLIE